MSKSSVDLRTILPFMALYGVIVLYAHAYSVWSFLSAQLGGIANYVPIVLSVLVLFVVIAVLIRNGATHSGSGARVDFKRRWLIAGLLCVVIALVLPDSNAPAKRIHIPEYLLLSFAIFSVLRHKLAGGSLIIMSVLITTLYGAHDEMIQGLLPRRSFGFKDIMVDGLSGLGGVCIAYSLSSSTSMGVSRSLAFVRHGSNIITKKWMVLTLLLVSTQLLMVYFGSNESAVNWALAYVSIATVGYWFSLYWTNAWHVNKAMMIVLYCLVFSLPLYLSSTALVSSLIFK